ncbi:MAG: PASTA domain-containing protein [Desulfobacterales bacterium]|jgi:serine/threonine-protein kinase
MIGRIIKIAALCVIFIGVAGITSYFTLSFIIKSEDTVIVPDFVGKDVVYVLESLTELGLNTKVKGSEYNADVPKNYIIFQEPKAGSEIKKGRDVKIIFSKGPQMIPMPNLAGLSPQQARLIFEEQDLCRGSLATVFDIGTDKDTVIAQSPPSGATVRRGSCVDLLVSEGPRPTAYKMPDLSGLQLEDALLTIERYHLPHGEIKAQIEKGKSKNSVLEQEPPAGYRVIEGDEVNLVINRRKEAGTVAGGIFHYRIDNGFLKRHIRVQLNRDGLTNDLFDDFVSPGKDIWLIIPRDRPATLLVYDDDRLVRTEVYDN